MKRISLFLAFLLVASMSTVAYAQEEGAPSPDDTLVTITQEEPAATPDTAFVVTQEDIKVEVPPDGIAPVLKDVREVSEDGNQRIIKTWEILPGYAPEQLIEPDFQKNGYNFKKGYLLMISENQQSLQKLASQTVTVNHEKKDGAIAQLVPLLDYNEDGYKGQLKLDVSSIYTEAVGKQSYTYAITDKREYTGLERNDTYNIPKTVEKNGATLQLQGVDWTEMGEGSYRALASYSGNAVGSNVTGYTSTAIYLGEVQKDTLDSITYAVVYEGTPIPLPPPDYLLYTLTGLGALVAALIMVGLWHRRRNTKIYALIDGQYRVVHRIKVSYIDPIIDLTAPSLGGLARDYLVVIDRFAAKRLNNQFIRVLCADGTVKEHRMVNNGYGCKLKVGAVPTDEFEED